MPDKPEKPILKTSDSSIKSDGFFNKIAGSILLAFVESIDFIFDAIKYTIGLLWEGFADAMLVTWGILTKQFEKTWGESKDKRWNKLVLFLSRHDAIDDETIKDLNKLKGLDEPLEYLTYLFTWAAAVGVFIKQYMYAATADIRRKLMRDFEPENIDVNSVMRAVFTAPEKMEEAKKILEEAGYSDSQIDMLFISMYRLYDEGVISRLFLRGEIDEPTMFEKMRQLGFTDERTRDIVKLWERIPSIQDIVRYIAKEAFEPDKIEMFGLMEEYPVEAEIWGAKQGVSKKWVEAEWVAHWRDLGIDFMLEAFHRHIVDWDLVKSYMSLIEIPPRLQSIVRDTAFRVYTRVDVRRMHKIGVLDDEELVQAYQDQGYDTDKAAKMAQFTIRYNIQNQKDLTKSEVLKGYAENIIPKNEALAMLIDMEYSEGEAEYLVTYEDYKEGKKLEDLVLKNIASRYQENLIDQTEARTRLNNLNLSGERIELLIEKWLINKSDDTKLPTKSDCDKFLINNLIDENEYRDKLRALGYKPYDINIYIKLINLSSKEE